MTCCVFSGTVLLIVVVVVLALDSIVDSINETVRKYCMADNSRPSPDPNVTPANSTFASNTNFPSPSISRPRFDTSVLPHAARDHGFQRLLNSSGKMMQTNNDTEEVSFARLAQQIFTPPSKDDISMVSSKSVSVDVGIQVNPTDFVSDDATAGRAEIGIQAGGGELNGDFDTADGADLEIRCCPYCRTRLPTENVTPAKDANTLPSNFEVASSVLVENSVTGSVEITATSSLVMSSAGIPSSVMSPAIIPSLVMSPATIPSLMTSPARIPSFVHCSLSLGDSFNYSPTRNTSSMAAAPITIYPSCSLSSLVHGEAVPTSMCSLVTNNSLNNDRMVSAEIPDGQDGFALQSNMFASVPNAASESVSESPLVDAFAVTISVTPESAQQPTSADSGGPMSNTSLSNITVSDLLPSMQGSIPLELLVNQTDGFTMYTEIVPVPELGHVDSLSLNFPNAPNFPLPLSSDTGNGIASEVGLTDAREPWSLTRMDLQQSPINVMVCLPLSSVSSPSLSSFLSQHKSLMSFAGAGDATTSRPPSPGDSIAATFVPDGVPKSTENYSIHRIVEPLELKRAEGDGLADCSWSSSNTGVLISRPDIRDNNSVTRCDDSGRDHGLQTPDNCQGIFIRLHFSHIFEFPAY